MPVELSVRVSFRILGKEIVPKMFSEFPAGKFHEAKGSNPYSCWNLCSSLSVESTLDDHLNWLLDMINPVRKLISRMVLEQDVQMQFFCSIFGYFPFDETTSGRLVISAETTKQIGNFGAEILVDFYASAEE